MKCFSETFVWLVFLVVSIFLFIYGLFNDASLSDAVLVVLGYSSVISVLAWTGLLPKKIGRRISENKADDTLVVLSRLGITPDKYLRPNISKSILGYVDASKIESSTEQLLAKCTLEGEFYVGHTESVKVDKFIDVMSVSANPESAAQMARVLTSFWKKILENNDSRISSPDINLVVTPKGGSPFLGYEFSKILGLPLALHYSGNKKFDTESREFIFKSKFDSQYEVKEGDVALIVDDSATGGRKVLQAIQDLRSCGLKVTECLVLFEPKVKGVRQRLNS